MTRGAPVELCDLLRGGLHALQAVHLCLERLHAHHSIGGIGALKQGAETLPQLGPRWLTARIGDVPCTGLGAGAGLDQGHAAVLASCPSACSSTRATTRRASKCSSTSARAARPCRS